MLYEADSMDEGAQKLALLGSLTLYLDFINLFLMLLRIFGGNKDYRYREVHIIIREQQTREVMPAQGLALPSSFLGYSYSPYLLAELIQCILNPTDLG